MKNLNPAGTDLISEEENMKLMQRLISKNFHLRKTAKGYKRKRHSRPIDRNGNPIKYKREYEIFKYESEIEEIRASQ